MLSESLVSGNEPLAAGMDQRSFFSSPHDPPQTGGTRVVGGGCTKTIFRVKDHSNWAEPRCAPWVQRTLRTGLQCPQGISQSCTSEFIWALLQVKMHWFWEPVASTDLVKLYRCRRRTLVSGVKLNAYTCGWPPNFWPQQMNVICIQSTGVQEEIKKTMHLWQSCTWQTDNLHPLSRWQTECSGCRVPLHIVGVQRPSLLSPTGRQSGQGLWSCPVCVVFDLKKNLLPLHRKYLFPRFFHMHKQSTRTYEHECIHKKEVQKMASVACFLCISDLRIFSAFSGTSTKTTHSWSQRTQLSVGSTLGIAFFLPPSTRKSSSTVPTGLPISSHSVNSFVAWSKVWSTKFSVF